MKKQEKTRVSYSEIRTYKSCRKKYWFSYIEGLKPRETGEALMMGRNYHSKVEAILKGESFESSDVKTTAMALAFGKYLLPQLPKVVETEKFFAKEIGKTNIEVIGYIDGICEDGTPIEHKSTSMSIGDEYRDKLWFDEQIPIYMWAEGVDEMWYTVCKKPSIRLKQNETEEEFAERCFDWYETDTEEKVTIFKVYRTQQDIDQHIQEVIDVTNEMRNQKHFFRNPYHCDGFMTCPYRSICLDYDPLIEPIGFEKETLKGKR